MAKTDPKSDPSAPVPDDRGIDPGAWVRRIVLVLALVVVAYIAYKLAASVVPREWAQHVGNQVDRSLSSGVMWGLFYGFVFTFGPIVVASLALAKMFNWAGRLVLVVVALALAMPNWLTLWVAQGSSHAAHSGDRIMDVYAPGFRWATTWGAVAGAAVAIALVFFVVRLRHRRHQVKGLKQELKSRDAKERSAREATDES